MRTRDKRRIVKLFLGGMGMDAISDKYWYQVYAPISKIRLDIESIIREYAIEADARAARREKRRKG